MATIQQEMCLDPCPKVVTIVLKRCPTTERAVQELLVQNDDNNHHHHPCPVCGSTEKCNGAGNTNYMSRVGVDLFQNLILALPLDPGGGDGGGGDSPTLENVQNYGCEECLGKFVMLESLQNDISLLEDKVEEILSQLRKTIRDRRGLISLPVKLPVRSTGPMLNMVTSQSQSTLSDIDQEENSFTSTTTAENGEDEEVDLKPVILHFRDELDHDGSADDGDDQYLPKNDDSDNTNQQELNSVATKKGRYYKRPPGIPSDPSNKLQKKNAKRICSVCGKRVKYLSHHMRSHRSRVSCEICHKTFSTPVVLSVHINTIHLKQFRYKCEKCGKGFGVRKKLELHLNRRNPCTEELLESRKLVCPVCNAGCSSPQSLQRHIGLVHSGEKKSNCEPISKLSVYDTMPVLEKMTDSGMSDMEGENPPTFTPMTMAENHEEEEIDLKPGFIHFPNERLADDRDDGNTDDPLRRVDLISEEQSLNNPDQFDQDQTNSNKSRLCKLQSTQMTAVILRNDDSVDGDDNGDDQYSPKNETDTDSDNANKCELDTNRHQLYKQKRSKMSSHASTKVTKQDGRDICTLCGKQDLDLTEHMLTHRLFRKKFHCETCNETFSTQEDAAAHRKTFHPPQKRQVICPICKTGSTSHQNLRSHIRRVHNGEKTINCGYQTCNSKFYIESDLKRHLKACHPDEKVTPDNVEVLDMTTHTHRRLNYTDENMEENTVTFTFMTTAGNNDEEVVDLKPVILEFQDELKLDDEDGGSADDPLGGIDLISKEQSMNNPYQDESSPNKSRRCKIRAKQVMAAILRNDDDADDDANGDDEYSPKIESDTDSDNINDLESDSSDTWQKVTKRKRAGVPSHSSTIVQQEDGKDICTVFAEQDGHVTKRVKPLGWDKIYKKSPTCDTCHKTFSTHLTLYVHKKKVHLQQLRQKCEKCGKRFYSPCHLKRHLNMRIPCTELLERFICPICKVGCSSKDHLLRHARQVHHRIYCPHSKCRSTFFAETNLKRHLELCHPQMQVSSEKFRCTVCDEAFSTVQQKLDHIQSCGNPSISNKRDLDDEHKTTLIKPYSCTKCGKKFSRVRYMKTHLRRTSCNPDKNEVDRVKKLRSKSRSQYLARKKSAKYKCEFCLNSYLLEEKLVEHISSRHRDADKESIV